MGFVSNAPGKKAGSAIGIAVVEQSAAQSTAFFPLQNKLPSSLSLCVFENVRKKVFFQCASTRMCFCRK